MGKQDSEYSRGWETFFFLSEIAMIAMYIVCTRYAEGTQGFSDNDADFAKENEAADYMMQQVYPMWQDINIMVFVGFGFLKAFLRTHSWSAVGFNLLIGAMACQWSVLCYGFFRMVFVENQFHTIPIDIRQLIHGSLGAATGLITMNALIGKATFGQMYLLVALEMVFYALNRVLIVDVFQAVDTGGTLTIHMFGAYFGLACQFYFKPRRAIRDVDEQGKGVYNSHLIAMVGTLFLFCYWPSFNSVLLTGVARQRAAINTWYAITASALTAAYVSRSSLGKLDMEVFLNATLAGGVMIGGCCDMIFNPGFAILVGGLAGIASSLGYLKLTTFMAKKVKIHDTCGIQYLHGIPG